MKTFKTIILFISTLFLYSCESSNIVGEPVAQKKYGNMGYRSILNYRYMQYTGDSAVLIMRVEEIESSIRHYNRSTLHMNADLVATSDSVPFEKEIIIPIIDDSVFTIKHICWIDSLTSFNDTLIHTVYVHKNEIVNPKPDTVSITRERLDSVIVRTYYMNPNYFWWL